MRFATLQTSPTLGKVEMNARRADVLLSKAKNVSGIDLLVCPEMALSGKSRFSLWLKFPIMERSYYELYRLLLDSSFPTSLGS